MASEEASLRALESLMTEFFHNCTTNERKREIEELLNNFAQQIGAWRFCLYFISSTRNDYVMMYSLTVFENLVNKMWLGVPSQDKMEIRSCLPKILLTHHKTLPYFIRNKLCKVIVDIGRQDWPMFYHDFFTNILQLIQSPVTTPLGLIMLKTTSEELACPREDLSIARKEELRKLLLDQVQTVLGLLTGILESIWDKYSVTAATPPPSPTSGESGDLLSSLLQSPSTAKLLNQPIPVLDAESEYVCSLALECLAHLFSWIPLSTSITPSLLTTIFHFARFGCDARARKMSSINGSSQNSVLGQERGRLGVLAMSCINELMSKNCVPVEFEEYLLRMFQQTFYLLQKITKENNAHSVKSRLDELDESYIEKFTDFLRLFVSVHLRRIESYSEFPVVEFLALLFKYTFHQPSHEGYFSCLDIWTLFLDYLTSKIKSRLADKEAVLNRYEDALVLLLTEVLNRIQFRYNQAQLEELDDEALDDDQQTEWQRYLRQSLEVIAKVMELLPTHAFSTLFPVLQENLDVYLGLQQFIVSSGSGHRLNITAENDCRRLHCSLRDLSSLLQAVGRLAEYFTGDMFAARFSDALTVVESTGTGQLRPSLQMFWTPTPTVPNPIFFCLCAPKAQAKHPWQMGSILRPLTTQLFNAKASLSAQGSILRPLTTQPFNAKASLSAQGSILRPLTTQLFNAKASLSAQGSILRPLTTQPFNAKTSLSAQGSILRPLTTQLFNAKASLSAQGSILGTLTTQLFNAKASLSAQGSILRPLTTQPFNVVIHQTLSVLEDIVESISGEATKSRQICYQSLQESVQVSLALFPAFIHQSDVTDEMLSFFLTLFQGLRVQMGVPFTEQVIQTFLNMFTREQLAESILHDGSTGCRVVEKFLKILQVVVQEPGQVFKPFLPNIISLCMEQVYPIVAERPSPDVKAELFELLFRVLHHNWRYFFKSSILASVQRGAADEQMENQAQFSAIMQAFGQSFLQPDIHLFKQNLFYLETLNTKQKLYHKKIFRTAMLFQFVNVLLQVLVHKSHDLLQEEIGIAIYNMASVDFDSFYSVFLPEFLASCDGVDANQKSVLGRNFKMDRDLPSFTQNVHRLVNDLRYYRLCNDSLPPGTVKL
uniref:Importin N-terminal domain-containing protein n=1 Tax=Anolis carolinensis TaxID=28377 RepID=H9GNQ4_ANOCA